MLADKLLVSFQESLFLLLNGEFTLKYKITMKDVIF